MLNLRNKIGSDLMDLAMMDVAYLLNTITCLCGWIVDPSLCLLAEIPLLTRWLGYIGVGLQVAAGLGFVIFVHEMGHFLAAKTFGVRCDKFYVGFDVPISIGPIRLPRTLGKFRWGETEYGIGIIPLGGYVKMLGQDDDPRNAEAEAARVRQGDGPDAPLDPRSYQAKPVWQRMIIISAGVVMNIIFAVFLAAAAFLYGVPYMPTTVGAVPLGAPSWESGLQPGDQVLQIAAMSKDDPHLRFEDMGGKTIFHGLKHGAQEIPITLVRDGNRMTIRATPTTALNPDGFYLLGINPANVAEVGGPPQKYSYLAAQNIDLRKGDKVIAVDGQPLPLDPDSGKILSGPMTDHFQAKWNQPVEITVQREVTGGGPTKTGAPSVETQELKFTLPPVPVKTLGLGFAIGPISSIRKGSVAEVAGLKPGDIIEQVNGQPVTDALALPMQVAQQLSAPVELVVRRPNTKTSAATAAETKAESAPSESSQTASPPSDAAGDQAEQLKFVLQTQEPPSFGTIGPISGQWGLDYFGIAYSVLPKINWVDPNAEKANSLVQPGDELTQVQFEISAAQRQQYAQEELVIPEEAEAITKYFTVPVLFSRLQALPEGIQLRCFLKRDNKVREAVLPLYYAKDWYWYQRGVLMSALQKVHQTDNVLEALSLGVSETGRRLGDVFEFLTILVTGRASPRNLAGPWGIAKVASQEASDSPSRLLLFLTLLSANLAILNFLPIPALDGGHMMFLTAEAIMGKPVKEALQVRLTMLGVMCLLGLMAFAILNDILREFK